MHHKQHYPFTSCALFFSFSVYSICECSAFSIYVLRGVINVLNQWTEIRWIVAQSLYLKLRKSIEQLFDNWVTTLSSEVPEWRERESVWMKNSSDEQSPYQFSLATFEHHLIFSVFIWYEAKIRRKKNQNVWNKHSMKNIPNRLSIHSNVEMISTNIKAKM